MMISGASSPWAGRRVRPGHRAVRPARHRSNLAFRPPFVRGEALVPAIAPHPRLATADPLLRSWSARTIMSAITRSASSLSKSANSSNRIAWRRRACGSLRSGRRCRTRSTACSIATHVVPLRRAGPQTVLATLALGLGMGVEAVLLPLRHALRDFRARVSSLDALGWVRGSRSRPTWVRLRMRGPYPYRIDARHKRRATAGRWRPPSVMRPGHLMMTWAPLRASSQIAARLAREGQPSERLVHGVTHG